MYSIDKILGNEKLVKNLKQIKENNKIAHAYIFEAQSGMGKSFIANSFAKSLLCENSVDSSCNECISCKTFESNNNPDFFYIKPESKKSIGVDQIKEIVDKQKIRPFKFKYKIFVIEADFLTSTAQNAFLKTLEDPTSYSKFILLSNTNANVLDTVKSRCITFKIQKLPQQTIKNELDILFPNSSKNDFFSAFANGNLGLAIKLCSDEKFNELREFAQKALVRLNNCKKYEIFNIYKDIEPYKNEIQTLLDIIYLFYRDCLISQENKDMSMQNGIIIDIAKLSKEKLIKNQEYILNCKINLQKNANFQLAIENLLFNLKQE